jgi:hypothetical protein
MGVTHALVVWLLGSIFLPSGGVTWGTDISRRNRYLHRTLLDVNRCKILLNGLLVNYKDMYHLLMFGHGWVKISGAKKKYSKFRGGDWLGWRKDRDHGPR